MRSQRRSTFFSILISQALRNRSLLGPCGGASILKSRLLSARISSDLHPSYHRLLSQASRFLTSMREFRCPDLLSGREAKPIAKELTNPPMQFKSLSLFGTILSLTIIFFSRLRSPRSAPLLRRRSNLVRVISTHPRLPVLLPSAPPAPCTAPTPARSTRSRGSQTRPPPTSASLPDGYANAATQDTFCANTSCTITKLYDQSPNHNDLTPAPPGGASHGPGPNGYDIPAVANALPVTVEWTQGLRHRHLTWHGLPQRQPERHSRQRSARRRLHGHLRTQSQQQVLL